MTDRFRIVPPASFVEEIDRHFGAEGHAWLATLPDRIAKIGMRWSLTVAGPPRHGAHALVLPVVRGNERFALKVAHPDETFAAELTGLRAWNGHGTVQVIDVLPDEGTMLMEWLDEGRDLTTLPIDDAIHEVGRLTHRLAIAPPPNATFPTTGERAAEIAATLAPRWEATERPFARDLLNQATVVAQTISSAHVQRDMSRMATWDLHAENVLWGNRAGWTMIDPMPLVGTPEVALAPFLWNRTEEIAGPAHLSRLVAAHGAAGRLDPDLTYRWLIARLVDYWLWGLRIGLTIDPMRCQTLLAWLAAEGHCPHP